MKIFNGTRKQNLQKLMQATSDTAFKKAKQTEKAVAIQRLAEGADKLTPENSSELFQPIPIMAQASLERSPETDMLHLSQTGFEAPAENIYLKNRSTLGVPSDVHNTPGQNWGLPELKDTDELKKIQQELSSQHPPMLLSIPDDGFRGLGNEPLLLKITPSNGKAPSRDDLTKAIAQIKADLKNPDSPLSKLLELMSRSNHADAIKDYSKLTYLDHDSLEAPIFSKKPSTLGVPPDVHCTPGQNWRVRLPENPFSNGSVPLNLPEALQKALEKFLTNATKDSVVLPDSHISCAYSADGVTNGIEHMIPSHPSSSSENFTGLPVFDRINQTGFETPKKNIFVQNRNELHFRDDATKDSVVLPDSPITPEQIKLGENIQKETKEIIRKQLQNEIGETLEKRDQGLIPIPQNLTAKSSRVEGATHIFPDNHDKNRP